MSDNFEIASNVDLTKLSRSPRSVGYLDPEIAGEGIKVSLGEKISYNTPATTAPIPDWSKIKLTKAADGRVINFQAYFYKTGYEPWPAWLYHPTEPAKLVDDQKAGAELGVYYREATQDERMRMGGKTALWDWAKDTLWRPMPYDGTQKPDIKAYGKELVIARADPALAQNALLAALVEALGKNTASASATAQTQLVEALVAALAKSGGSLPAAPVEEAPAESSALSGITPDEERELWKTEAEAKGIKVDGRWSIQRIKDEIEKAA